MKKTRKTYTQEEKTEYREKKNAEARSLASRLTERIKQLAETVDATAKSDLFTRFTETASKFHNYSLNNVMLIAWQMPTATHVAGYHAWPQKFNRYVKKGEKGIGILAPLLVKEDKNDPDSPRKLIGFKEVYVFDISQTDGEPLPPAPEWRSKERNEELNARLIDFANRQGISVTTAKNLRGAEGISKGKAIELLEDTGTKTLIHEVAHELLHRDENGKQLFTFTREIKELEAESVAHIVCQHFNMDDGTAPNYLVFWEATPEEILNHMERIRLAASIIITAIDPKETSED